MTQDSKRIHNFSAGPAQLPLEVLQQAQEELVDYHSKGHSVMEMSHRSEAYTEIDQQAKQRIRSLMGLGDEFQIIFLQGGASSQFMMVPFNFLDTNDIADYIDTGRWSAKAIKEAKIFGKVNTPYSSKESNYDRVPVNKKISLTPHTKYVHYTSNNTVAGSQFKKEPETKGIPLVCDASSDFLSRPVDVEKFGLIYAGAQKNVGPAGVTVVIIKNEFLETAKKEEVPTILQYQTHVEKIFNTPPVFNVYVMNLVLKWIQDRGGVSYFEDFNQQKAKLIYDAIDKDDFYEGAVEENSRSLMNVTFRLPDEKLEQKFITEATENNMIGLKGHRSVGGIRASIYNACPMESAQILAEFMDDFKEKNG